MSMIDYSPYEARKSAQTERYGASQARNAYARTLSQTRGQRKIAEMQTGFEKQTPNLIASYTQRGLAGPGVKSGVFTKGLQDFAERQFKDISGAQSDLAEELQGYDLQGRQDFADYQTSLVDIEAEKAREIRNAAATLNSYKPFSY
jgi:hypothetical protein